jgi:hypothetical protein
LTCINKISFFTTVIFTLGIYSLGDIGIMESPV